MTLYHIIDTETASLQGGVVEFAWIIIDSECKGIEMMQSRVNPECKIHPEAMKIHGITDADVANCPTMSDLFPEKVSVNFIAHNAAFDKRMVNKWIKADRTLCTLSLARKHFPQLPNHKLGTLVSELNLTKREFHAASEDVLAVLEFLRYTINYTGVSLETLFERENVPKVIHKMPFGKYKGFPLSAIPQDYAHWLLAQDDIDKDLRYSFDRLRICK